MKADGVGPSEMKKIFYRRHGQEPNANFAEYEGLMVRLHSTASPCRGFSALSQSSSSGTIIPFAFPSRSLH